MPRCNPEVDAYIARSAPFAQPILKKLRMLFHHGCPGLEEKIKWGCPSFEYKGMLCGMAAFKKHVAWGFWKAKLLKDPKGILKSTASSPMGGGSPTSVDELPPDAVLLGLIRQAVALNEAGVKLPAARKKQRPPLKVPADLTSALKKRPAASRTFAGFSPSHKREYVEWITQAKRPETRAARITQAVEWMADGKPRNWKYMKR